MTDLDRALTVTGKIWGDALDFRKQWDQWGWLLPASFFVVVFFRLLYGREAFCGPASEQCFREWVSALGGWAAVLAAIPTVYFLSKQIQSMSNYQRVNFANEVRSNMALASTAKKRANEVLLQAERLVNDEVDPNISIMKKVMRLGVAFEIARDALSQPVFNEFETRIASPGHSTILAVVEFLDGKVSSVERIKFDMAHKMTKTLLLDVDNLYNDFRTTVDYLRSIVEQADNFIDDINNLSKLNQ